MRTIPFLITFVLASVNCQQPSTVPGLIQSAASNGPLNVLRVRQPTVIERSSSPSQASPIRRAPISLPISSNLLDEETRDNYPSDPYNFGYDVRDDYGNHQYRKEEADGRGTVRGTYGYTDANGLFRYVDYIADSNGFQAKIRSNEPGIGAGQAANILLTAEEPPRSVLDLPSAPRPTLQRLRAPRLPDNVAFHPIDVHPIASERSERLRYNFPLPSNSESNEAASDREEIIYSDEQPGAHFNYQPSTSPSPVTSSPRAYRSERLSTGSISTVPRSSNEN